MAFVFRGKTTDTNELVSIKFTGICKPLIEIMSVEKNFNCVVKKKNSLEKNFEATGQLFSSIDVAQEYVRILRTLRCPYTAKGYFCVNTEEYGPMAIVERLTGMGNWVQTKDKFMWRLGKDGQSAGFGFGFLNTLSQILDGLKSLHQAGHRHGNLWGGVHFGADNNIRLNNFGVGCIISGENRPSDVLWDFTEVSALCSFWIASDPPSRELLEVDYFFRFFRFNQSYSMIDVEIVSKFLYKLPKMFHETTIAVLFIFVNQLKSITREDGDPANTFINMGKYYDHTWSNKISTQELLEVLYHPYGAPTINPDNAKLDVNYLHYPNINTEAYHRAGGIKLFARNALPHAAETFAEAVGFVLNDYPVIHLQFLLELIQIKNLKTKVVIKGKGVPFHEYLSDALLLDDVTR